MIPRAFEDLLVERLREPRRSIQVLLGPRHVGKTTAARRALARLGRPSSYATAEPPGLRDERWIVESWSAARESARRSGGAVLVLDEVQCLPAWSESVKLLWDEDSRHGTPLHVVLLGSAPRRVRSALGASLAGRFEVLHATHGSFAEMRDAFGWSVEDYVLHGGYPGAAALVSDPVRWARHVRESLIETTLSRDVLLESNDVEPSLLRRLFALACRHPARELTDTELLDALKDAGDSATIARGLQLLSDAGLVTALEPFTESALHTRSSTTRMIVWNNALVTANADRAPTEWRADPEFWGALVENAVGAHLLNGTAGGNEELASVRDRDLEVGFVLSRGERRVAIEVKRGPGRAPSQGLIDFVERHPGTRWIFVGPEGVQLEQFLTLPATYWFDER